MAPSLCFPWSQAPWLHFAYVSSSDMVCRAIWTTGKSGSMFEAGTGKPNCATTTHSVPQNVGCLASLLRLVARLLLARNLPNVPPALFLVRILLPFSITTKLDLRHFARLDLDV